MPTDSDSQPDVLPHDYLLTEPEIAELFSLLPKELGRFRRAGVLKGQTYYDPWWNPTPRYRYSLQDVIRLSYSLLAPGGVYRVFANELPSGWQHPQFGPDLWTVESERETALSPVARIVDILLKNAVEEEATDIFFQNYRSDIVIRLRVHGKLKEGLHLPPETYANVVRRIKLISGLNPMLHRQLQHGLLKVFVADKASGQVIWIRVRILPTLNSEHVQLRLSYPKVPSLTEWEMSDEVRSLLVHSGGIVLLAGRANTGVTTVFRAALSQHVQHNRKVVLIESEQEIPLAEVSHIHLPRGAALTNVDAVRTALRQGAEVIAFSDLSTKDATEAALEATEAGATVLVSLRTNGSGVLGAFRRIVWLGVPAESLAHCLTGIVSISGKPHESLAFEALTVTDTVRTFLADHSQHPVPFDSVDSPSDAAEG